MHLVATVAAWALLGVSGEVLTGTPQEDAVLLQFVSARCPHCRAMQPVIQQLVQQGLRVEAVDVDRQSDLAVQHRITAVPTFVAWRGGREIGRQVGVATASQLLALWGAAEGPRALAGEEGRSAAARRAQAASVRLRVEDAGGYSFGTGTIIDQHEQEALVITCGHLFRSSGGRGKITVDLFIGPVRSVEGQLLVYDLERDVALVSLHGCPPVQPAIIAPPGHVVRPGDAAFSIGCDRGAEPTIRTTRITAVNKYRGKPNYTAAGQPVDGRSGGGLFTAEGLLIGVCNAADPADDEGLYAALPSIHWQLDQVGLAEIYQRPAQPSSALAAAPFQEHPQTLSPAPVPTAVGTPGEPVLPPTGGLDDEWELVVIVRSRRNPARPSEVYVVDAAAGDLMQRITLAAQETGQRRAAQAARSAASVASAPAGTGGMRPGGPVVRAQSGEQR